MDNLPLKKINESVAKKHNITNLLAVPRLSKIVVNCGVNTNIKGDKIKQEMKESLERITGQKVVETKAKKSIAGFKIREGQLVGYKVTLRKQRAHDFLLKLVHVVLPRVRDFAGIKTSTIDRDGNMTIGIKDAFVFPEVDREKVTTFFGLEICITFTPKNRSVIISFLEALGLPLIQ